MSILAHVFGSAEGVTSAAIDDKVADLKAEMTTEHVRFSSASALLLAPAMLTDEQHVSAETDAANARRSADRLLDTIAQLEAARIEVVEAEALRRQADDLEEFRGQVAACVARSRVMQDRLQAEYVPAARALAGLFADVGAVRAEIRNLSDQGRDLGEVVEIPDPEEPRMAYYRARGQYVGPLDQGIRLPGLMHGDSQIYPAV